MKFQGVGAFVVVVLVAGFLVSSGGGVVGQNNDPYQGLSYLQQWSAFFQTTFNAHNTDDQGRLAAGGDVTLSNYEVGTLLNNSNCGRVDLLVGGNLVFVNGQVPNGEVLVSGTSTLTSVTEECSTVTTTSPIDFDSAFAALSSVAQTLAALSPNGVSSVSLDTLTLTGTSSDKNIFAVSGSSLAGITQINLNIPGGSFGIINVDGSVNTFANLQIDLSGDTSYRYILWNFFETKQLTISGISVSGSLLAPAAEIQFNDGNIQGSIAAYSCNGTGEIHYFPILPFCPPCLPCTHNISLPDWSIFIQNDVNLTSTDDRGNFAAGGNVWLTHYEIGADLPAYVPGVVDTVVGGNLVLNSGEITNGDAIVGGTATLINAGVVGGGQLYQNTPSPIDFGTTFQTLAILSGSLAALTPNGQVSSGFGGVVSALGSDIGLNVFQLESAILANITQLNISVPFNSWVVINVNNEEGTSNTIANLQINLNGINATNVLYNFPDSNALDISGVRIEGTILAPSADITFNDGAIDGSLIGASLYGTGEVHHFPWTPYGTNCPPCPPCNPDDARSSF